MPLSLTTAATVRHLEQTKSLGPAATRQPYEQTETAITELSKAVDEFFPSIDETAQDGAPGQPGLVRYHQTQGTQVSRVQVEFQGDSTEGRYLQEWVNGGYLFTEFSPDAVDHFGVGPQGVQHLHLDRNDPSQSYAEFIQGGWNVFDNNPAPRRSPSDACRIGHHRNRLRIWSLERG